MEDEVEEDADSIINVATEVEVTPRSRQCGCKVWVGGLSQSLPTLHTSIETRCLIDERRKLVINENRSYHQTHGCV